MITGIIVFAHGSRVESANEAVRSVARDLVRASACDRVVAAFLELGQPDLETAAARLVEAGVERVVIIPYFLTLGLHMERDLPPLVERISNTYKGLLVEVTPPMDGHPALVNVLVDRYRSLSNT